MNKVLMLIASAALGGLAMTTTGLADHKSDHENDRHDDDTLRYGPDPRIGEEVRSICFGRSINGWRAVKGEDDVVLLQRGVSHWYRVELLGACDYRVLRSAIAIGIDSRPSGGCITRGDAIIVEDSPGFNRRCSIKRMYEWNEDAVTEAEDATDADEVKDGDH